MATLKPLWLSLTDLSARLQRATTLRVACDYDGTLTPIVETPTAARLPERTHDVLERLARRNDVKLAILSGRKLDDLQSLLGIPGAFLAGASGLETQDEGGSRRRNLGPEEGLPADLRSQLTSWCERFPGSWVEDKDVSIALHYRAVVPDLQPAFGAGVRRRVRPFKSAVTLIHGKRVFEVVPSVAGDKASAVGQWLDRVGDESGPLLFFGDDTNDEPVHALIRQRGGIAVAVGRTVSRAEHVLPSPLEVTWFLEWLDREWESRSVSLPVSVEVGEFQNA
jgi:trehalose 6-phosphate phosphatase